MIIDLYGNNKDSTKDTLATQRTRFDDYFAGQRRYIRFEPVDACTNDAECRGWWAALHADAEMEAMAIDEVLS